MIACSCVSAACCAKSWQLPSSPSAIAAGACSFHCLERTELCVGFQVRFDHQKLSWRLAIPDMASCGRRGCVQVTERTFKHTALERPLSPVVHVCHTAWRQCMSWSPVDAPHRAFPKMGASACMQQANKSLKWYHQLHA